MGFIPLTFLGLHQVALSRIGSAEQAFAEKFLLNGDICGPWPYQAVTPCFRNEPTDLWHLKYFIKNELFYFVRGDSSTYKTKLGSLCQQALDFFRDEMNISCSLIQVGPQAFDIFAHEPESSLIDAGFAVELGSYGIRETPHGSWVYGTGCAEPRTSQVQAALLEWAWVQQKAEEEANGGFPGVTGSKCFP